MSRLIDSISSFNEEVYTELQESVAQRIAVFNAGSRGTILLDSNTFRGDLKVESFYKYIADSAAYDRAPDDTTALSETKVAQANANTVKIGQGIGPITIPNGILNWADQDIATAIANVADQAAQNMMKRMLNGSLGAAIAVVENNSGTVHNETTSPVTQSSMNSALALFGDASPSVIAFAMDGGMYHRLVGQAISGSVDGIAGVAIQEGVAFAQGRPIIVTDAPAFSATSKDRVLGLTAGAIKVTESAFDVATDKPTGRKNLRTLWQAEYDYALGLKGYSFTGTVAPSTAALATNTNWTKVATSNKDTAGVLALGTTP